MSENTANSSISAFLERGGAEYRWFEMGRRVMPIDASVIRDVEEGGAAYPYPLLRQAWLALLFWRAGSPDKQQVWFLKLPLDEQGKLDLTARDGFLTLLLEELAKHEKAKEEGNESQEEEPAAPNPYVFQPSEDRRAMFHAWANKTLERDPSSHYEFAREYFTGELEQDQWRFVGYQGVADLAVRLDQVDQDKMAAFIPGMPAEPYGALCACLENASLDGALAQAIANRSAATTDVDERVAAARALSQCADEDLRIQALKAMLEGESAKRAEVLAAICNRAWTALQDESLRMAYLEALASNNLGQDLFNEVMLDLMYLPGMRGPMLESLRNPQRSATLSEAIGNWFKQIGV